LVAWLSAHGYTYPSIVPAVPPSRPDAHSLRLHPSSTMILPSISPLPNVSYVQRSKSRLSLGLTNNALSDTALVLVRLLIIFGPALSAPA